jgi:hypothetical protein
LTSNYAIRSIVTVVVGTDYDKDTDTNCESLKNREKSIDIYTEMQKISWFSKSNNNTMDYLYDIQQFFEQSILLDNNENTNAISKPIPIPIPVFVQSNYG